MVPVMPIAARAKSPTRLLVLAAVGLAAALSGCDASSGPTGPTADSEVRQVTVVGSGEVKGTPDTLNVNASIEFIAPDVTGAMNQTSERQQAVIHALVDAGRRPQRHQHQSGEPAAAVRADHRQHRHLRLPGEQLDRREDASARRGVAGVGAHRQHRRRRDPDQHGELLDRRRFAARPRRARPRLQ